MAKKQSKKRGTFIHGIGASEHLDSSGERIRVEGIDISSLTKDGVFNWEHKSEESTQIVGKILEAKKILKKSDCTNDNHRYFWDQVKMPFLYVAGELFDAVGHSGAKDVAAMLKYDSQGHEKKEAKNLINFSIEGSRLEKRGSEILKCIARKMTITITPCNKVAVAEEMKRDDDKTTSKAATDDFSFISDITSAMDKSEHISSCQIAKSINPGEMGFLNTNIKSEKSVKKTMGNYKPKRTFTPSTAPDKMKVGDRIDHTAPKPPPKPGQYGKVIVKSKKKNVEDLKIDLKKDKKKVKKSSGLPGEFKPKYAKDPTPEERAKGIAAVDAAAKKIQTERENASKDRRRKKRAKASGLSDAKTTKLAASEGMKKAKVDQLMPEEQRKTARKQRKFFTPEKPRFTSEDAKARRKTREKMKARRQQLGKYESNVRKALAASCGMGAPSTLSQGAALQNEEIVKKDKKQIKKIMKTISEESFQRLTKKEELLDFLAKRLPNLDEKQITALAKAVAYVREKKQELKLKALIDDE